MTRNLCGVRDRRMASVDARNGGPGGAIPVKMRANPAQGGHTNGRLGSAPPM